MILTGWPVTGRDAQVVPVVAQDHQTFPLGGRRDQQVSRARGPVLASQRKCIADEHAAPVSPANATCRVNEIIEFLI